MFSLILSSIFKHQFLLKNNKSVEKDLIIQNHIFFQMDDKMWLSIQDSIILILNHNTQISKIPEIESTFNVQPHIAPNCVVWTLNAYKICKKTQSV